MATVTKDFKIKSGLIVEGANGTINGSDIITEDIITGGTQTNITVAYNPSTKTLDFTAENGVADSTTDDLQEGNLNQYFTDARAKDSAAALLTTATLNNISITGTGNGGLTITAENGVADSTTDDLQEGQNNLYYTDARARGAISVDPAGPLSYSANSGQLDLVTSNGLEVNEFGKLQVKDAYIETLASGVTTTAINALTTSDIEEGTNLYFTNQRAIDAVGGSATSANTPDTVVKRDSTGSFAAQDITANDITAQTVTFGSQAGTVSANTTGLNIESAFGDINLDSNVGINLNATSGDIVLRPDMLNELGKAYIGSTTAGNEIATHSYVDNAVSGLNWKEAVNLLATSNVSLSIGAAAFPIDGHSVPTEDYRVLLTAQTNATENGIWVYSAVSEQWSRPADADTVAELDGAAVFVIEGTQYNATSWVQNNHYATTFDQLVWTQFSGSGNYTAGFGINLVGREFSADTTEMATSQALGDAVANLTDYVDGFLNSNDGTTIQYIDDQDAATLLAANTFSTDLVATGDAAATPQYLAINVNDVAKQVAATSSAFATLPATVYSFDPASYRSAKFLVKVAYGTHTEVSEVLLTLDTSNNIAITEYAVVGTNGSMSTISADLIAGVVGLIVTPVNDASITVVGTLLV